MADQAENPARQELPAGGSREHDAMDQETSQDFVLDVLLRRGELEVLEESQRDINNPPVAEFSAEEDHGKNPPKQDNSCTADTGTDKPLFPQAKECTAVVSKQKSNPTQQLKTMSSTVSAKSDEPLDVAVGLSPTVLRREAGIVTRTETQPGAVAIEPVGVMTASVDPSNSSPARDEENAGPTHEVLVNAVLVEEGGNQDDIIAVEAKKMGFKAIVLNRRFPYVAAAIVILLLAIVIPVVLLVGDNNSNSSNNNNNNPANGAPACGSRLNFQADYQGTVNVTETGKTCQRWDSLSPHLHSFSQLGEGNENYCRNPDGAQRPWCYTTDPDVRFQFCNVPYCDGGPFLRETLSDCGSIGLSQREYRGTINVTVTGKSCQPWNDQFPHAHQNTHDNRPNAGLLDNNYCRNPSGFEPLAWCYTTDPDQVWDYCRVPVCAEKSSQQRVPPHNLTAETFSVEDCGTEALSQMDYQGIINTTLSGRSCLSWNEVVDAIEDNAVERNPILNLLLQEGDEDGTEATHNYCRNYEGSELSDAFCYTTAPGSTKNITREYCQVPFCPREGVDARKACGAKSRWQADYRGDMKNTVYLNRCLDWSNSEHAQAEGFTPENMPLAGLVGNYCRNPDPSGERQRAWCYVSHLTEVGAWEYCTVPDCQECGTDYLKKIDYQGTVSVSQNGSECMDWADGHAGFGYVADLYNLEANYCRNPVGRQDDVYCLVKSNDSAYVIETCDVPTCT